MLLIISYFAIIEFNLIFKKIFKRNHFYQFISIIISLIFIIFFSLLIWNILYLADLPQKISFIFLLLICISTDVGGFVFGKLIGGKKLTKISPKKTYSGLFGSFIFSLTTGYILFFFNAYYLNFKLNLWFIILIISLISQCGDLIISYLKRKAKIKDTGSILPGHGGILDRIDGILFALPVGINLITI